MGQALEKIDKQKGLPVRQEGSLPVRQDWAGQLSGLLGAQHAMHGVFGNVFDRLGGEDFIYEWAVDHPTQFIKILVSMAPGLMPTAGMQGDVHLHVHHELKPTALDGHSDIA
jgi:hypothetical protein